MIAPQSIIAATSVSARSGVASHSSRTRSCASACLTTTAIPAAGTCAAITVADTPPGSSATSIATSAGARPRRTRYAAAFADVSSNIAADATDRQNRTMIDLTYDADGTARCGWCGDDPLYRAYHDEEWGREKRGDDALFELLSLEGFQAGLSWLTILRKREGFRQAFAGFSIERVAEFDERDVERLLGDAAIVRHRGKIEATIGNAGAALELPGGLSDFVWGFAPPPRSGRPDRYG